MVHQDRWQEIQSRDFASGAFRAFLAGFVLMVAQAAFFSSVVVAGELEPVDIQSVNQIAASPNRPDVFAATASGQLVKWSAGTQSVLVEDLRAEPAQLKEIHALLAREASITAFGVRGDQLAWGGYRFKQQDGVEFAEWQPGLSVPLVQLAGAKFACLAVTAVNIYVVASGEQEQKIWRVPAGVATLGEAELLHASKEPILAMAMNFQGHLLTAIRDRADENASVALRFHHATTGKPLIQVATDMQTLSSMAVGTDELLYAVGTVEGKTGLYRLDVGLKDGRQTIVARLLHPGDWKQVVSAEKALYLRGDAGLRRLPL